MRALAVLAVVWAHAKLPGLPGGFTGVDVFFVISGFLITRLLLAEMTRTGRIDLLAFWARRARRLLPNAFATLIGTALLALFLFPGYDPRELAWEITFSALEVVNFHFIDKAVDYFQSESPASPVLHFWSLSVEEQFYMVWPLLLMAVGAYFRQTFLRTAAILLALIWVLSFAASVSVTYIEQPIAYFSTGTRFWQLATGALLAAHWQAVERLPRQCRAALAWCGLLAVLTGFAVLGDDVPYPGMWALLPTLGAAGLLLGLGAARSDRPLRRALAWPVMQWIGARSYSWYLWHWPLFVLPRLTYPDTPYVELIAVPVSLAVACAAYSWIETPLRRGQFALAGSTETFARAVAALILTVGIAHGYRHALPLVNPTAAEKLAQIRALSEDRTKSSTDGCLLSKPKVDQPDCLYGDLAGRRRLVLFGDSHADHWFPALHAAAKTAGWRLSAWTKSSCPSADVSLRAPGKSAKTACLAWRDGVMRRLIEERPELVILSNRTNFDKKNLYDYRTGISLSEKEAEEAWREGLRRTIRRLVAAGIQVVVIRDIPRANDRYQACLLVSDKCTTSRAEALANTPVDAEVAQEFGSLVSLVDFTNHFCDSASCPVQRSGTTIYRDSHHLTATYSATFAPEMVKLLESVSYKLDKDWTPAQAENAAGSTLMTNKPFPLQ